MKIDEESGNNRAIFLDRDGTINVDKGYLYRKEDIEYLDGVIDALRILYNMGFWLVIVTNQSGIARGYYTEQEFMELDAWIKADLKKYGVRIRATYYCPHCTEGVITKYAKKCICRKPKTGLFWKAKEELNINMGRSFVIGDKMRDLMICRECKITGILLSDKKIKDSRILTCVSWKEILQAIMSAMEKEVENV